MSKSYILIGCFITIFLILCLVINKVFALIEERKKSLERISSVITSDGSLLHEGDENFAFKKNQGSLLEKKIAQFLRGRPQTETAIRLKLYRAGMTGYLSHLIIASLVVSFLIVFTISEITASNPIYNIFYGLSLTAVIIYMTLGFFENRYKIKVVNQLPNAIEIILRGIKSGSSVEKTFVIVIKEVDEPLKLEFSRIIQQIEFGVSFDDALHQAADRIALSDFYFFSTSLIIQRKAGGSLAEILENIINSLNRANEIRSKIKVLSAESKVTAYILGALPAVLWIVMLNLNPSYLDFFRHEAAGKRLLLMAFGLIICAALSIRQMLRIKV